MSLEVCFISCRFIHLCPSPEGALNRKHSKTVRLEPIHILQISGLGHTQMDLQIQLCEMLDWTAPHRPEPSNFLFSFPDCDNAQVLPSLNPVLNLSRAMLCCAAWRPGHVKQHCSGFDAEAVSLPHEDSPARCFSTNSR